MRTPTILAFTACVLYGLTSLVGTACAENSPTQLESDLVIGYSRLRISLPLFVAQQNGIFAKHGLKVQLLEYDTAQPLMQALVEGKIAVGGYTAFPITFNGMLRSGKKLIFLTLLVEDQKHRLSYLLRRKVQEPQHQSINNIADLKGKRVGILPTIAYKAWLAAILRFNGVNPADVAAQPIEPELEVQALSSGGVDALFTGDPAATVAIAKGVGEFISNKVEVPEVFGEPFPFGSFNVSKDWADSHPELLERLVAALNEAIIFVNTHPADAKQNMKPYMPDAFKPYVDLFPDARYLTTDESDEKILLDEAKRELDIGIIKQPMNLDGLIYVKGHYR